MKPHEMREMTLDELQVRHDEMVDEFVNLRVKLSMRQLDNPMRVRILRREIARARTIIREKQAGAMPGQHTPGREAGASE
jgi:large subunit ribosomal protein L29